MDYSRTLPLLVLLFLSLLSTMEAHPMRARRDAEVPQEESVAPVVDDQNRKDRSLNFLNNFLNLAAELGGGMAAGLGGGLGGGSLGGGSLGGGSLGGGGSYGGYENEADLDLYDEDLSRTSPRRKIQSSYGGNQQFGSGGYSNSPVYYIRMPPSPYVFVPGLGYVSPPPSMNTSPLAQLPPAPPPQSPFVNLPLEFISNAKPTGVYWGGKKPKPAKPSKPSTSGSSKPASVKPPKPQYAWPQPAVKPASQYDSPVTNLQGQYTFNGRPSGLYVLKSPFNSFYSDVLQSFYP